MTMAGGMFGLTIEKFLINTAAFSLESETVVAAMLVQNAYTPNFDTHDFRNDVTNEPSNSGTYAAGGSVLTTTELVVASPAATQISYIADNLSWTGTTITARGTVIYNKTGGASSTDQVVVANAFAGDVVTSGGTFTVQWDATNKIFYVDYA